LLGFYPVTIFLDVESGLSPKKPLQKGRCMGSTPAQVDAGSRKRKNNPLVYLEAQSTVTKTSRS